MDGLVPAQPEAQDSVLTWEMRDLDKTLKETTLQLS